MAGRKREISIASSVSTPAQPIYRYSSRNRPLSPETAGNSVHGRVICGVPAWRANRHPRGTRGKVMIRRLFHIAHCRRQRMAYEAKFAGVVAEVDVSGAVFVLLQPAASLFGGGAGNRRLWLQSQSDWPMERAEARLRSRRAEVGVGGADPGGLLVEVADGPEVRMKMWKTMGNIPAAMAGLTKPCPPVHQRTRGCRTWAANDARESGNLTAARPTPVRWPREKKARSGWSDPTPPGGEESFSGRYGAAVGRRREPQNRNVHYSVRGSSWRYDVQWPKHSATSWQRALLLAAIPLPSDSSPR